MLRPVIVLVVVLNTINGIKVFDQIWVMTAGGPNHASDTLGTYLYSIAFGGDGQLQPAARLRHRDRHRHPRAQR